MKGKMKSVLLLIVSLVILLTACGGKLKGTYTSQKGIAQTFIFDGDNVTMSAFGINATGTYKIDGDQIVITYTIFGMEYAWEQSFSKSGNTINIGGTEFKKQ